MTTRTLSEIAQLCGAVLDGDGARTVDGPASLGEASASEVSFFSDPRYRADLEATAAAGVLVPVETKTERSDLTLLRCSNPSAAFTKVVAEFATADHVLAPGVHETAVIDESAEVAASASIGPQCVVSAGATIADEVVLHAGVFVGAGARIGAQTVVHPNATFYDRTVIGERCIVHAGTVMGSDGFGFDPTPEGWVKIPQCGNVVIEDDVEVGANVTIDRGRFGATRIRRGAKLDNLVHVAHNVIVGELALLVAQVGVSGSTEIGKRAILGGQSGVAGHVKIGDGARVGGQSGVFGDMPPAVDWIGWPARPRKEALRRIALTNRLPKLVERIEQLEARIAELEGGAS